MCCKSWKTILPFALAFFAGVLTVDVWVSKSKVETKASNDFIYSNGKSYGYLDDSSNKGRGSAACCGGDGCKKQNDIFNYQDNGQSSEVIKSKSEITPLKIFANPNFSQMKPDKIKRMESLD